MSTESDPGTWTAPYVQGGEPLPDDYPYLTDELRDRPGRRGRPARPAVEVLGERDVGRPPRVRPDRDPAAARRPVRDRRGHGRRAARSCAPAPPAAPCRRRRWGGPADPDLPRAARRRAAGGAHRAGRRAGDGAGARRQHRARRAARASRPGRPASTRPARTAPTSCSWPATRSSADRSLQRERRLHPPGLVHDLDPPHPLDPPEAAPARGDQPHRGAVARRQGCPAAETASSRTPASRSGSRRRKPVTRDDVDAAVRGQVRAEHLRQQPVEPDPGPVLLGVPAAGAVEDGADVVPAVEVAPPPPGRGCPPRRRRAWPACSSGTASPIHWVTGIAAGSSVPRSVRAGRPPSAPGAPVSRSAASVPVQSDGGARRQRGGPQQGPAGEVGGARPLPPAPGVHDQQGEDDDRGRDVHLQRGDAAQRPPGPGTPTVCSTPVTTVSATSTPRATAAVGSRRIGRSPPCPADDHGLPRHEQEDAETGGAVTATTTADRRPCPPRRRARRCRRPSAAARAARGWCAVPRAGAGAAGAVRPCPPVCAAGAGPPRPSPRCRGARPPRRGAGHGAARGSGGRRRRGSRRRRSRPAGTPRARRTRPGTAVSRSGGTPKKQAPSPSSTAVSSISSDGHAGVDVPVRHRPAGLVAVGPALVRLGVAVEVGGLVRQRHDQQRRPAHAGQPAVRGRRRRWSRTRTARAPRATPAPGTPSPG